MSREKAQLFKGSFLKKAAFGEHRKQVTLCQTGIAVLLLFLIIKSDTVTLVVYIVNTLMLGKTEGRKRRGQQTVSWLGGTTDSMDMSLSKLQDMVKDREAWRAAKAPPLCGVADSRTRLSN